MAKIKKRKQMISDVIQSKKVNARKKILNPFEVHINKEKIRILGKKQKNENKGLLGISKAKAIQKRKKTLLQEYKLQNKSNKFNDKRIGEKNHSMTEEDKVVARFTAVRVKAHNKKSIFNLADDEILTHHGQTLSEIEKFDDPRSDDESLEDGENGKLNPDFVDVHFGGGLLRKTNNEGAQSHKSVIEQLITESKKRKAEQQKLKEATLELTEQLDTEWKDLIPLVAQKNTKEVDKEKNDMDDYDKIMRELKFAARGTVSNRLKTEDEEAKEEKERLEKLEQDRLLRMKGVITDSKFQSVHRSADDIDDDFVYEDINCTLSYDEEGKSNLPVDGIIVTNNGEKVDDEGQSSETSEQGESEDEDIDDDNEDVDHLSDLQSNSSDDENEENKSYKNQESILPKKNVTDISITCNKIEQKSGKEKETEKIKEDLIKRKCIMEQAMKELPFTFPFPHSYESLHELIHKQSSIHQTIIIDRIIKCNHPSLAEENKEKLSILFAFLLQYLNDLFGECDEESTLKANFHTFEALVPKLFDLAQLNPENAHQSLLEVIKEKQHDYRKTPKKYPGLEVLIFLKLVSLLLPTSDFRHQVVTPCFIFMEQLLTKCKVQCMKDISYGMFLVTLVLEFTSLSKRFLPAAINFLTGILHMAIPKTGVRLIKVLPPFKATSTDLVLVENLSSNYQQDIKLNTSSLLNKNIAESYKINVLYATLKLLEEFHMHFKECPSHVEIFCPVFKYIEAIPMEKYPELVQNTHENLVRVLKNSRDEQKLPYMVMKASKPKALRMLEPKIVEVFDRRRYKVQSKDKAERDKLIYKLKKEKKGALREIRKDKDFLGRVKIQQQIKSDQQRLDKVKRIYAEAASQQSELNSLDRKKKRKH